MDADAASPSGSRCRSRPCSSASGGSSGAATRERVPNPDDGRSFLIRLTPEGQRLLDRARPAFRDYAEAVEARLGPKRIDELRAAMIELRQAIDAELEARAEVTEPVAQHGRLSPRWPRQSRDSLTRSCARTSAA